VRLSATNSLSGGVSGHVNYNLMMQTPVVLPGLHTLAGRYDIFLLDQFGVLHNGVKPFDGVIEALWHLKSVCGAKMVIVSNTSSRSKTALQKLAQMGFPQGIFDGVVTSGQCAYDYLDQRPQGIKKVCWVTWNSFSDDSFISDLNMTVSSIEEADILLLHGTQVVATSDTECVSIPTYQSGLIDGYLSHVLRTAIERDLPIVCSNLDMTAVHGIEQSIKYMPGTILEELRNLGALSERLILFGKPNAEHFEQAIDLVLPKDEQPPTSSSPGANSRGIIPNAYRWRRNIVHIGDSIEHDIAGASASRIDSVLVTKYGVHKGDLHATANASLPLLMKVCDFCDARRLPRPYYILEEFRL
jgi:HAD superfamily hydrolase (TIGR01450 family)